MSFWPLTRLKLLELANAMNWPSALIDGLSAWLLPVVVAAPATPLTRAVVPATWSNTNTSLSPLLSALAADQVGAAGGTANAMNWPSALIDGLSAWLSPVVLPEPATPLTSRVVPVPRSNTNTSVALLLSFWPLTRSVLELTKAMAVPSALIAGLSESPLPVASGRAGRLANQTDRPGREVEHEHVIEGIVALAADQIAAGADEGDDLAIGGGSPGVLGIAVAGGGGRTIHAAD